MDTGDLELVRILIRESEERMRNEMSMLSVPTVPEYDFSDIYNRLAALESVPEIPVESVTQVELIEAEAEAAAEIIEAEAEATATIIEAEAEAAVTIAEAVAENNLTVTETEIPPEPEGEEMLPEMQRIIESDGDVPEPEPKRSGGWWNNPLARINRA